MARGNLAKEEATKIIKEAFGDKFIAEADKKLYVWCDDGGEQVQIAISLTCPKNPITANNSTKSSLVSFDGQGFDFTVDTGVNTPKDVEFTEDEKQTIEELMAKLGL